MSSQKTQIANLALIRIGVSKTITDVDTESSTEARLIRLAWDNERDAVLEDFPWPFARKYVTLGLTGGSSTTAVNNDWQYSYGYPSDCLFARRLVTVAGRNNTAPPPFVIGQDDDGQLIFTDESEAVLEYTARVLDPSRFTALFSSALAWKIAATVATPLSRVKDIMTAAERGYAIEISRARARALNESQQDDAAESEFIRARD